MIHLEWPSVLYCKKKSYTGVQVLDNFKCDFKSYVDAIILYKRHTKKLLFQLI